MAFDCILLVGFGDLAPLAAAAAARYPQCEIHFAQTAAAGLAHVRAGRIFLQPLYLLPGFEYEKLCREAAAYPGQATVGTPLLHAENAVASLAKILLAEHVENPREQAVLFVGHGSAHPAGRLYAQLNTLLREQSEGRAALGVLDGQPDFADAQSWITQNKLNRLRLAPLMLHAGKHVQREIIGDGAESWRTRLESAGLEVCPVNRGLLEYGAVREMVFNGLPL